MSALSGIRIVELSERPCGEYCGKLLADFGAEVVKIERPGRGSPTRQFGPFATAGGGSLLFSYLNTNKSSLPLDLDDEAGVRQLHALVAAADIVIDDHPGQWLRQRGLDAATLARDYPSLVFCHITPYGSEAPEAWLPAHSLNVFHSSGWGYHTPGNADADEPPLQAAGRFLVDYEAGLDAALCTAAALLRQLESGTGEFIDIAERDVMVSRADTVLGRNLAGEEPLSERRDAFEMGGPAASFACRDGYLFLFMTTAQHWRALGQLMDQPRWMEDFPEDWLEFGLSDERVACFRENFARWIADKGKEETYQEAQRLGIPFAPLNHAEDVLHSVQFRHRGFFQPLALPGTGVVDFPTAPYRMSATPVALRHPAPALGELRCDPSAWQREPGRQALRETAAPGRDTCCHRRGGPLAGVRVLELTKVWAGPYAGKLLALLGAEVIKVESESKLDEMRAYGGTDINSAPYFLCLNPEVLSVQINMKTAEGLDHLRALVARSDIVLDNLRPGVMAGMGLDFDSLRAIRPDIVAASIKMFGNDGPLGFQTGFAPSFAALGGLSQMVGYEGQPPCGMNMRYGDATVGAAAAFGAVIALVHARRSGEGQFVDLSAVEVMSSMIGDSLLAFAVSGDFPTSPGNYHPDMAPHGCYPCRDGAWLSLAVDSDAAWNSLCALLGAQDLAAEPQFKSLAGRQQARKAIDAALGEYTREWNAGELAGALRAAGVAAAASLDTRALVGEDWLWQRGTYCQVSHRDGRQRPVIAAPWRLLRHPVTVCHGAPDLGEHNGYVFRELLGMSDEQLEQQVALGVVK
ncbi:CaiB/BaiF CoA transferase family protein [Haliea sp. E17]|uniref:CaiB/BaiF CoA transferase family protein n=1 Tax=Haliea sp. E17 TaxID=3401576 RepID=UPI003AAC00BD